MYSLDDLGQVAEDLRKQGIAAEHDFLYGPHGCVEGLDVGDDFYPKWELLLAENAESLKHADFAAIKRRRREDWSLDHPCAKMAAS